MKKLITFLVTVVLVICCNVVMAQNSTDNSVSESIKIERADGTNIIITGNGDNTIHYNSAPDDAVNATQVQAKFQVIIRETPKGFVLIIPNARYVSQDEMETTVDEAVIELAKNQKWDLIWAE